MENRKALFSALVIFTLVIGVGIGSIVSERVTATGQATTPVQLAIPDPVQLSSVFRQVAAQVGPAVVHINTTTTVEAPMLDPFGGLDEFLFGPDGPPRSRGLGSGIIVDSSGYILTNDHVIDGADEISVRLADESEHDATIVGVDPLTDLAVIKIDAGRELPVARMGNSDSMQPGDWVLALGSPFGFDNSLTAGIVSAIGRPGDMQFQRFIQTDAAINPGNSGGPLVNMNGEVIGINTAIITSTESFAGIGFALPSNTAINVYNQISATGKVTRGSIGISYVDDESVLEGFGFDYGVVVGEVTGGGPAEAAGFEVNDVITAIDGERVRDGDVLLDIVSSQPIGGTISVEVYRVGETQPRTLDVTIDDRAVVHAQETSRLERPAAPDTQPSRLGLQVQEIPAEIRRTLPRGVEGVLVARVERSGAGADAGLASGMIITQIIEGRQQAIDIGSIDEFRRAERMLERSSRIVLVVMAQSADGAWIRGFRPIVVP
jgi:serine protease Do